MKKICELFESSSRLWSVMQRETAEKYGEIVDVPFPAVACDLTDSGLEELAEQITRDILALEPTAVMCMGRVL